MTAASGTAGGIATADAVPETGHGERGPGEGQPAGQSGVLPSQAIRGLVASGAIRADTPVAEAQVQPASLDLRLGKVAYRVQASFLPGRDMAVAEKLADLSLHELDLTESAVLERGCVYIVPLQESLALDGKIAAIANPKSSTGRLDIFTRLITDGGPQFDRVRRGYTGPLYAEISPRTFSVVVRAGSRLSQIRFKRGRPTASDTALKRLQRQTSLVDRDLSEDDIQQGIPFTVDLSGLGPDGLVGYRARRHSGLVDVDVVGRYDPADYWEPVHARGRRGIILNPDDFYILASREAVAVPADHAAEMVPYDTLMGEFRVHYAGFFDPGFGADEGGGSSRAVLEVRSHEVPFLIEHGQIVGRLIYERLTETPDRLYGQGIGSSYQRQGLALAKQFKRA